MRRIVYSSGFALLLVFLAVSAPNAAEAGFLRNPDGTITELVTPDGQTTIPMSINNSGMINGLTYQNTYFIRDVSGNYTTFAPPSPYILYGSWINSSGEVAGSYIGHTTPYQAFIRDTSGNITTFAVDAPGILPGDQETAVRGITDSGTVVGFNLIPPTGGSVNPSTEGFIRDASGNITNVFIPGSSSTQISAANGNGDVAGTFTTTDGLIHGFYRTSSGVVTLFDATNNETVLNVSAVNNSGVITGFAYGSSAGGHAFVRDASGNITSFNVAGSTTNAYGINSQGDIVGSYSSNPGTQSFLRDASGNITPINYGITSYAIGINDQGQIIGGAVVPEPGSVVLMALGSAVMIVFARKRRRG